MSTMFSAVNIPTMGSLLPSPPAPDALAPHPPESSSKCMSTSSVVASTTLPSSESIMFSSSTARSFARQVSVSGRVPSPPGWCSLGRAKSFLRRDNSPRRQHNLLRGLLLRRSRYGELLRPATSCNTINSLLSFPSLIIICYCLRSHLPISHALVALGILFIEYLFSGLGCPVVDPVFALVEPCSALF